MKIVRSLIAFVLKRFTAVGIFVHLNTKLEVTVRLAYIICITRITFKFIHNVLLVISEGFVSMTFKSSEIFLGWILWSTPP